MTVGATRPVGLSDGPGRVPGARVRMGSGSIMVCAGLLAGLFGLDVPALAQGADPVAGTPETSPLDPRLREQLLSFAPYISMRNKLTLGENEPASVAAVLAEWTGGREHNERLFDAHASLAAAYRDVRAFLVGSQGRITPALAELTIVPIEVGPDASFQLRLAASLLEAAVEIRKSAAILEWVEEYDRKCRAAYARVLPLMRRTSPGEEWSDRSVRVRHWFTDEDWVFLEAVNESGMTLHNVSLFVRLETIDGDSCDHYYFIPEWSRETADRGDHRYALRLAADWWRIGAEATTAADASVVSDEIIVGRVRSEIPDHVPAAADRLMDLMEPQVVANERPKVVMRRLETMRPKLGRYPDRLARLNDQYKRAGDALDKVVGELDLKIAESKRKVAGYEKPLRRINGKSQVGTYPDEVRKGHLRKEKERLKKLETERMEWLRGER